MATSPLTVAVLATAPAEKARVCIDNDVPSNPMLTATVAMLDTSSNRTKLRPNHSLPGRAGHGWRGRGPGARLILKPQ